MKNPGDDQKITNADEQEVAVNSSTTDDGGYDEPVNRTEKPAANESDVKVKEEGGKKVTSPPTHHTKAN